MYLKSKSVGRDKIDSRWEDGIWLGIREDTGESIIGTQEGVIKARSVRRKAIMSDRWNIEEFDKCKGGPWKPVPGRHGDEIMIRASIPDTRPVEKVKELTGEEPTKRRVIITKEMVHKYGFTQRCAGCAAISRGTAKQPHTEQSQDRGSIKAGWRRQP